MMFKNIWLCLGCFSFFVSCEQKQRTIISKPPNVVFISIDDLNDWVGFLGDKEAITPHMDSLANKGYSFLNAHCPAPVCGPSRTAILSGKWPVTTGVYDNQVNFAKDFFDTKSLPEHFKLNGYQVFGVGKIFHGRGTPINAFDSYGGRMGSSAPFDSKDLRNNKQNPSHEVIKQGKKFLLPLNGMPADRYWNKSNTFDWGAVDLPDSLFADRVSVDWAIK
ncbi:sulfatase-like hydrolase/transferase, partial [Flavobacteriaceae bacterium]|nr:sulfatase-like hydrolase/transferase [Flavobacteriaceae bacterium]